MSFRMLESFDTVEHCNCITLLHDKYEVDRTEPEWFQPYLADLQFRVRVGDYRSDPHNFSCGVPQGSVLGPVVFNMYTTSLEQIVNQPKHMYHKCADEPADM